MKREEITEMLASVGVTPMAMRPTSFKGYLEVFQKFADLVAAKEREECAKVCDIAAKCCNGFASWVVADVSKEIRSRGRQ